MTDTEDAAPAVAAGPSGSVFALVAIGALECGVPAEQVLHALARPEALTPLPRTRDALEGVFMHRGEAVPVVDLRRWMGAVDPVSPPPGQLLVLRCGTRRVGLAVEAVRGLLRVPPGGVHRVHRDEALAEFFHSVAQGEGRDHAVPLLDAGRLMEQVRVWTESPLVEASGAATPGGAPDATGESAQCGAFHALVRCGALTLGFVATEVGEVLPMPPLQRVFGRRSGLLGMARWRGRDVPVIDVLQALGLPEPPAPPPGWLLVVATQGRCLGIPVDEVLAVSELAPSAIQGAQDSGLPEPGLYRGLVSRPPGEALGETAGEAPSGAADAGLIHVLDGAALMDRFPISVLSEAARNGSAAQAGATAEAADRMALVVFRAGEVWAAPMAAMEEITPFPRDFVPSDETRPGLVGSFEWRGQVLPLMDLRLQAGQGRTPTVPEARVIVLRVDGRLAGLLVDEVLALLPAHVAVHTRVSLGPGRSLHMVTVGRGVEQVSYQVLDLATLGVAPARQRVA